MTRLMVGAAWFALKHRARKVYARAWVWAAAFALMLPYGAGG